MKMLLLTGLLLFCSFMSFGQEKLSDKNDERAEVRIKKMILVTDLENQIKNIPFAAIRVYARYRIASWLLKDGKDDTERAEEIARAAIDDHYKNKDEIPPQYFFDSQLFVLLDVHAKDVAKQLRDKYKISAEDESLIPAMLRQKGGDKLAVDAAIRILSRQNERSPDLVYLLMTLEQRGSPELYRLLGSMLVADQTGRARISTNMVEILTRFFVKREVTVEMRTQFLRLVLARSRNVAALSAPEQWAYYRTLQKLLPEISSETPEILAEAGTVHALLSAQVSRSTREANEMNERINNSSDPIAARVAEAERADDDIIKYALYKSAARLALSNKRFVYAVDLMEKASEIDISASGLPEDSLRKEHDQFYRDVVTTGLEANEPDAANHAVKKMNAPLSKAEGLRKISKYYIDKDDLDSGRYAHDEAIKHINKGESSPESIATIIRMLPATNTMDPVRVFELTKIIAKSINAIPSLSAEDKPDTQNYRDYVTKVMTINLDLRSALTELVKVNRSSAADIADRIEKKEIRIIADYVLLTDSIDSLLKQKKKTTESSILSLQGSGPSVGKRNVMSENILAFR